jgi:DNA-binding NarL/FixJ family response regulator
MPVRILVADDDSSIRMLLRRLLEDHREWQVCGEAASGSDAVGKVSQLTPDLVVLDLAMPGMNGFQAAREIGKHKPQVPMLLLTVQEISVELLDEARRCGFRGAVSKQTGVEVIKGVEALLRNETYFKPESSTQVAHP